MANEQPVDLSLDDLKVKIRETNKNPNIGKTHQVVLKDGPRAYRIATIFEILDPANNSLHHLSLRLDSFDHVKNKWSHKPDRSIRLEGKEPNEIASLSRFLRAILDEHYPLEAGDIHVVNAAMYNNVEEIIKVVPQINSKGRLQILQRLLHNLDRSSLNADEFIAAFEQSSEEVLRNIAIASRLVEYRKAYQLFSDLVSDPDTPEPKIQKHLDKNAWIFGSEYSELLKRRTWTRDDRLDFMLRRTVDGFLEIVEIKTPFQEALLRYDSSHDSYFPSAKLSAVIGQVIRYIEEVERGRDSILAKDGSDTLKIRARIIIGRDGDTEQQNALRNFNAHLHRIEIYTFDQLLRVGKRVLDIFQEQITQDDEPLFDEDNIPF